MPNNRAPKALKNLALGDKVSVQMPCVIDDDDNVEIIDCTGIIIGLLHYSPHLRYEDATVLFNSETMLNSCWQVNVLIDKNNDLRLRQANYPDVLVYRSKDVKRLEIPKGVRYEPAEEKWKYMSHRRKGR